MCLMGYTLIRSPFLSPRNNPWALSSSSHTLNDNLTVGVINAINAINKEALLQEQ